MPASDTGAAELLANLSISAVLLIALGLTVLRLLLLRMKTSPQLGASPEVPSWARSAAEILESLIIAGVLVFLIIRPFFVQAYFIPSESMENTLMGHDAGTNSFTGAEHTDSIHDHIFVNKLVYRFESPKRGDIIVFRAPASADTEDRNNHLPEKENVLIKRLIGVPGDTIQVKDSGVWRNRQLLKEPYIKEPMQPDVSNAAPFAVGQPLTLGKGQMFVMGDNRNNSNDSRYWGPLDSFRVIGRADVIFWPLNRIRLLH